MTDLWFTLVGVALVCVLGIVLFFTEIKEHGR